MAKKAKKTRLIYVLDNGEVYNVVSVTGKYYVCECGTQFRKGANRGILKKVDADSEPVAEGTEG